MTFSESSESPWYVSGYSQFPNFFSWWISKHFRRQILSEIAWKHMSHHIWSSWHLALQIFRNCAIASGSVALEKISDTHLVWILSLPLSRSRGNTSFWPRGISNYLAFDTAVSMHYFVWQKVWRTWPQCRLFLTRYAYCNVFDPLFDIATPMAATPFLAEMLSTENRLTKFKPLCNLEVIDSLIWLAVAGQFPFPLII